MSGTDVAVGNGVSTELADLHGEMRADIGAWRRDPYKGQRYRELLDAKETGTTAPAARSGAAQRLGAIEALMRTPAGLAHYRKTPALRAEYLALIEARETGAAVPAVQSPAQRPEAKPEPSGHSARSLHTWLHTPAARSGGTVQDWLDTQPAKRAEAGAVADQAAAAPDAWRASEEQARKQLPAALVAEWDEEEGGFAFTANLRRLQDGVQAVVQGIGSVPEATAFLDSVAALPSGVKTAIYREAAMPPAGYVRPLTDNEREGWRLLPGGPETEKSWGRAAERKIAIAFQRFNRMYHSGMGMTDRGVFQKWWRRQPPRTQQIFMWCLGNG